VATDQGLPALNARLSAIQDLLKGDMTSAGHAVGRGGRTEANAVARDVTGGDMVLSHMGRKGARLGMRYDVTEQGRTVTMKLVPAGPWILTARGAKPHTIPRATRRRRRGGGNARFVFGPSYQHPVRGPIEHPGTSGKDSIGRALARMRTRAPRDFHDEYVSKLARVMA
jgi:hypothetical protein